MSKQTINGDEVEVRVFAPDGTMETSAALTERELATVQAVDAALKDNPEFQAAYPGARLEWVESMRGMDEHREGRYYLRYHSASGATEFWGHVSRKSKVDFKKGRGELWSPVPPEGSKDRPFMRGEVPRGLTIFSLFAATCITRPPVREQ